MPDNRLERERLQAEALKANLRRRKSQSRAQKEAEAVKTSDAGNPGQTAPDNANR